MDILKNGYEQAVISMVPIETDMTLDEFCQSDLEGYEYVKGKLIPMAPPTMEHGEISMSLRLTFRYSHSRKSAGAFVSRGYRL